MDWISKINPRFTNLVQSNKVLFFLNAKKQRLVIEKKKRENKKV